MVFGFDWIESDHRLTVRKNEDFLRKTNPTKRQVLLAVSQVFNPLGFMTSIFLRGSMLKNNSERHKVKSVTRRQLKKLTPNFTNCCKKRVT